MWTWEESQQMTATAVSRRIDGEAVKTMELEEGRGIPSLDGGTLGTRSHETWKSADGTISSGVWECDEGRFQAKFAGYGETMHVVSGEVECTGVDGTNFTLRPGDSMTFPRGWTGEWNIRTKLRKVYTTWDKE